VKLKTNISNAKRRNYIGLSNVSSVVTAMLWKQRPMCTARRAHSEMDPSWPPRAPKAPVEWEVGCKI